MSSFTATAPSSSGEGEGVGGGEGKEEGVVLSKEELNGEVLACARYGEAEDLVTVLQAGGDPDTTDYNGNTGLHLAAANGEVESMKILKEHGAKYTKNSSGNTPLHWAVQNQKLDAIKFIFDNYEVDVLEQNSFGRSTLTDAFATSNTDIIELLLNHPSSSEEKLLPKEAPVENAESSEEASSVIHSFKFNESNQILKIRELAITRADNPFGSKESWEDDTTGLGIWPASVILSQWLLSMPEVFTGKTVLELGSGCGLPGFAVATYCKPKSVILSDIHQQALDNLQFNKELNNTDCQISRINWEDESTFPQESIDYLIGSDLIYDVEILSLFFFAVTRLMTPETTLFYAAPNENRAGIEALCGVLEAGNIQCVAKVSAPERYYENPLASGDNDEFVLHFYDVAAHKEYSLYTFKKM